MIYKSIADLSYDSINKIVVCNYDNEFIDFDNSKGILRKPQLPNTPDMLYVDNNKEEIWFVEFKSSNFDNLNSLNEKIKLRKKLFAALFLIYELFCDKSCEYKKYRKYYFIVYNKKYFSGYEDEVLGYFDENSERSVEFGLEDLKPQFVNDIFTESCENLKRLFQQRFGIKFE